MASIYEVIGTILWLCSMTVLASCFAGNTPIARHSPASAAASAFKPFDRKIGSILLGGGPLWRIAPACGRYERNKARIRVSLSPVHARIVTVRTS